jgi:FixJ family two-component response regulator
MNEASPIVYVVDDDQSICAALKRLINAVGLQVETFNSPQEFLGWQHPDAPGCAILDVCLPGMSGLDLQRELAEAGVNLPIIFLTSHGDIPMTVRAMKAGAVEFLTKPIRNQELLDAINQALDQDRQARRHRADLSVLQEHYDSLTPREREVMARVVRGMLNKQIAAELGTSEVTIKAHRAQVMAKMQAESLADLVRMGERLESLPPKTSP